MQTIEFLKQCVAEVKKRFRDDLLRDPVDFGNLGSDTPYNDRVMRIALTATLTQLGWELRCDERIDKILLGKEKLSPRAIATLVEYAPQVKTDRPSGAIGGAWIHNEEQARAFFTAFVEELWRAIDQREIANDPKCSDLPHNYFLDSAPIFGTPERIACLSRIFALNAEDPRDLYWAIRAYDQIAWIRYYAERVHHLKPAYLRQLGSYVTDIFLTTKGDTLIT